MRSNRAVVTVAALVAGLTTLMPSHVGAAPTVGGREWRELYETTGLSHAQVDIGVPHRRRHAVQRDRRRQEPHRLGVGH